MKNNESKARELANCEENASSLIVKKGASRIKKELAGIIPPEFFNPHTAGQIHIHDMEFYGSTYNCLGILPSDYAEGAKDFHTAVLRLIGGITELTNCQSGGIGVLDFDGDLSKYIGSEDDDALCREMTDFLKIMNLPLRKGCEKAYVTLNFGLDCSENGRRLTKALLGAYRAGVYIFPNLVFTVKSGVNLRETDPNYDIFLMAAETTAVCMNPTYLNLDADFNADMALGKFGIMGCRSRVAANRFSDNGSLHRGNVAAVSVNLVRIALEGGDGGFIRLLDERLETARDMLLHRFRTLAEGGNFRHLKEKNLYVGAAEGGSADMLKNGTLAIGFIGLWDCFCLTHGYWGIQGNEITLAILELFRKEGLDIVGHMRKKIDDFSAETNMNFSLLASSGEGISGFFPEKDKKVFTSRDFPEYYTNSFHTPVNADISCFEKIDAEAPFHKLCSGGHITYIELAEAPLGNGEAVRELVTYACCKNAGYFGINYPMDVCGQCGFKGTFGSCPRCGGNDITRLRRVSGYLAEDKVMTRGKQAEVSRRVANIGRIDRGGEIENVSGD